MLLATWTILGLFLDVWSHGQFGSDAFLSIWHALFFPGFLATAGYIISPFVRSWRTGQTPSAGAPAVYDLGLVGVLLFLVGVIGDTIWHAVVGVERGIEAVMSPAHILMLLGLVLIASIPFRAAWAAGRAGPEAPSFRELLPALLSITLATLIICLGALYLWAFSNARLMNPLGLERIARDLGANTVGAVVSEAAQQLGMAGLIITNSLLLAPVLIMLRRWHLPFGSVTLLFTVVAGLMAAVSGMFFPLLVLAPVGGGLCADWLNRRWRPSPHRVGALRAFALVVPLVTWGLYFVAVHTMWTMAWSPLLWAGALMWTAASSLGLSVIAVPGGTRTND
jgi:hypothetical protein